MKSVCYSLVALLITTVAMASVPAFAQGSSTEMTDAHIAFIKSNCQTALGTLATIHANDAPIYINRNQTYFSVGDKLMARMNSRLSLNHFDASDLLSIAGDYDVALNSFRDSYKSYDDTMADLLRINCVKQPVSFYDKVTDARKARQKVNDAEKQLQSLISDYQHHIEQLKTLHADKLDGGNS